jgi:hypothetical protein
MQNGEIFYEPETYEKLLEAEGAVGEVHQFKQRGPGGT